MSLKKALLLSSSNCHGYATLEFAKQEIVNFLSKSDTKELVFVPYAMKDYDAYTDKIKKVLEPWGFDVVGIHTHPDPAKVIASANAVFVGGGNTFLLLKTMYECGLVNLIRKRVMEGDLLYMGSSAGTNVATRGINTTNDMPIVYPQSFFGIQIVPFNINPHYIEVENEKHKGETRDERIWQYLDMPQAAPVLGLREGSLLDVDGDTLTIKGVAGAVLFQRGGQKTEYPVGSDVSFLDP